METKMTVSFANIVTAEIETDIINQSPRKHSFGKDTLTTFFFYGTQTKRQ